MAGNNFVVISDFDDVDGIEDAGTAMLIDGSTGEEVFEQRVSGIAKSDLEGAFVVADPDGEFYLLSMPLADNSGIEVSGKVLFVVPE